MVAHLVRWMVYNTPYLDKVTLVPTSSPLTELESLYTNLVLIDSMKAEPLAPRTMLAVVAYRSDSLVVEVVMSFVGVDRKIRQEQFLKER
jgi:hypothetical protein